VIAQRLLRRLCMVCRVPQHDPIPERVRRFVPAGATLYQAVGCPDCASTGYRGRFGIVEILEMTQELERLVGRGVTADQLAATARAAGMRTLFDSGLRHVLLGETSIDELLRVTEPPREDQAAGPGAGGPKRVRELDDSGPRRALRRSEAEEAGGGPVPVTVVPGGSGRPDRISSPGIEFSPAFELLEDLPPARAELTRKGALVLLVDDEDQLRRVMRDLLQRQGYTVVEARDGAEALDEVDRHAPDIVILDLNLPGVDGYSVLSQLRSRTATRQIPIVVLTAKGDEDNEVRVLELGADDFLTKPFRAKALAARLENALSRRRV
jgi:CheY-like chemotaxis protein